ncbi:MAG: ABC transporter ATP-binding protein [Caloramator sp.]|nr:ABC transporter ATP-binding protein [Caloramator sp.]
MKDEIALEIKNLNYTALSNEILKNISCNFKKGLFYSIIGPNGSGKTTLLRHISRNLMPREDVILIEGKDAAYFKGTDFAKIVSYVPQQIDSSCTFTAFDVVLMGRYPYIKRFEGEKKKDVDIALWAMKVTNTFAIKDKNINFLSGGERQRVIIARAIAQQGKILLLDEPTSHLDIHHQIEIMDTLKQLNINYGITVLCVLHDLNTACEYSDYIVVMKDGKIENMGKPQDVLNEKIIKNVYGIDVSIIKNPVNGNFHIIPQSNLKSYSKCIGSI